MIAKEIPKLEGKDIDRFLSQIKFSNKCWEFQKGVRKNNYCVFYFKGKKYAAHRVSYEFFYKRKLNRNKPIDHLCRNPRCVNPAHLEEVTDKENVLRGISPAAIAAKRSCCAKGHEYTTKNTYWRTQKGRTWRRCRKCLQEYMSVYLKPWRKKRKELSKN